MSKYVKYEECRQELLASDYRLEHKQELDPGKVYLDTYIKKGNHVMLLLSYGPNWCDLICWVNYNGEDWKELAGTKPIAYQSKRTNLLMVDHDRFMDAVCRYEYDQLEVEFKKIEIESMLEALP